MQDYFGRGFVGAKRKPLASHKNLLCESFCESQGSAQRNQFDCAEIKMAGDSQSNRPCNTLKRQAYFLSIKVQYP